MKRRASEKDWLPLSGRGRVSAGEPTGEAFRPEWIDFERGIRVGNLEPHERITQILKYRLERRFGTAFVTDRWGRGVYWQWICWLPRANREAKPLSSSVNFGCAKLFIGMDREQRFFQSGLQVERGYLRGSDSPAIVLQEDWDWHRLMRACRKGSALDEELKRLLRKEGFTAEIGDWENNAVFDKSNFTSAAQLRSVSRGVLGDRWGGFQLYFPMPEAEVRACSGYEFIEAVFATFLEVIPAMNRCMQVELPAVQQPPRLGSGPTPER